MEEKDLSNLMRGDEITGIFKKPKLSDQLESLYDTLPKHRFTFSEPNLGKDLDVEYVLINSSQRPKGEDSIAFALCRGINFLIISERKIFICDDLVPNRNFFKYIAIHEEVETRSCHSTATLVEMKIAEQEMNDDELRQYVNFRSSIDNALNGSDGFYQNLRNRLPEKVQRYLNPPNCD